MKERTSTVNFEHPVSNWWVACDVGSRIFFCYKGDYRSMAWLRWNTSKIIIPVTRDEYRSIIRTWENMNTAQKLIKKIISDGRRHWRVDGNIKIPVCREVSCD